MAFIKISELRPAGSELFQDSESFLNELGEQEMAIAGGGYNNTVASVISQASISVGISILTKSVVSQNNDYRYSFFKK
ncbi:hypothetical protein [Calothrix sp. 336/3]|uniref:hypothetical protein n=1 Tax=Calothrix sp. 336/3 TaxID=1337936 RepID=UPI0005549E66|nr:hypothetical protein [Calothrix sp. 336/3]AKG20535.1 hypothetical protein IJ00_03685 [Calothrix sp. 336/3]